ncbi:MAG: FG-GAP-like repeat-containing protein [Candidatus Moraniibacteriota bacterium]
MSEGTGQEKESYQFTNAKLRLNEEGAVEVYYFGDQDLKNQEAQKDVPQDLMERAQRTLQKELGQDIMSGNQAPDLLIPAPYYYDKDGNYHEAKWQVQDTTLSLEFQIDQNLYPIALDPTLAFTAPGVANGGVAITGEATSSSFGTSLASGDFNADGKIDLAVGSSGYLANTGRTYLFYNDGVYASDATNADVTITGESSSNFGNSLTAGDFNSDGKTDLAAGANTYSSSAGRTYIFYNDGSIPTTAATADVTITGEASSQFGISLATGDFNGDGKTDLTVGANTYSSNTGRAYIFLNDGSIPTTAATADVTITGEAASNFFGQTLTSGDFNADGKTDLTIGALGYSSNTGRAYLFYNDGSIPTTAATADVTITGETGSYFGTALTSGDFNADGRTDLAASAQGYSSGAFTGRAYLFYNDGSIPTDAGSADVAITGESVVTFFGLSLVAGDFNGDGKTDLAVGTSFPSSSSGRTYIFYQSGSIPTTAATADVIITGEVSSGFGASLAAGDFNSDGKTDLAVGAVGSRGRTYLFYSQNGQVNTNKSITGEAGDSFGWSLAAGDFNADGRMDLAVGANAYSSNTGRVYIFYNDSSYPSGASGADVTITGETTSNNFGYSVTAGDFNADSKTDLGVGAPDYSSGTGRTYIFLSDGSIPTTAATADVIITGEGLENYFGLVLASGDFNADGRTDIAVSTSLYSSFTGRAYIFLNDGSIPTTAATADVIITGETTSNNFGISLAAGDFNSDGRIDLAVGANTYSSNTGRAYIFLNDGSIPTTAATADVAITGEDSSQFGNSLTSGDFNSDGKTDLVVGANDYSANTGRTYIFYNDGSYPSDAENADVTITGETDSAFGSSFTAGDFNADGKTDLAVGAYTFSSVTGRVYIFYQSGSIPTTAATADVAITGENTDDYFGLALASGDFNADGKVDLVVGAKGYSSTTGRVYLYETRDNFAWELQPQPLGRTRISPAGSGQEMKIVGQPGLIASSFGYTLTSGDFNSDGKKDLAIGTYDYTFSVTSFYVGRVYLFYNDGSYASNAASADVVIAGEATNSFFGQTFASGDFNADGKTDLAVGASSYSSGRGRAYLFYNDGSYPSEASGADVMITGEATSNFFSIALTAGDFNSDGKTDLAAGSQNYSSFSGRTYIFYNDGSYPTDAASADVTITGETTNNQFGRTLTSGDFNADGKTDLVVGANRYSSFTGRTYIFYNDGSYPSDAATADVIITGETPGDNFSYTFEVGDFNSDGKTDLAVGAYAYSSSTGRAYIFYNDGSIPTTAATADVIITGEASSAFGTSLTSGDFNSDGRPDLAAGASQASSFAGRTYIFYNDGSIPTTAATADVIITGEVGTSAGSSLSSGDFNADGKTDLLVGGAGTAYIYTFNDAGITGESSSNQLGISLISGDFNSDGKTDLAVGAYGYSTNTGRVYIFYNDGSIPTTAATADVAITGEASSALDYPSPQATSTPMAKRISRLEPT